MPDYRNLVIRSIGKAPLREAHETDLDSDTPMSALTIFGLVAVTAMLVFYALEERNPLYILGFAVACALGSTYGFLQGAWPFGIVEAVWTIVAVQKWRLKRGSEPRAQPHPPTSPRQSAKPDS